MFGVARASAECIGYDALTEITILGLSPGQKLVGAVSDVMSVAELI
jgi:hypothetical protein